MLNVKTDVSKKFFEIEFLDVFEKFPDDVLDADVGACLEKVFENV